MIIIRTIYDTHLVRPGPKNMQDLEVGKLFIVNTHIDKKSE